MNKRTTLWCAGAVFALASTASAGDLIWDNNVQTNGFNGRALSPPVFPNIRVADDILVPETGWLVTEFKMSGIEDDGWDAGDMMEVTIYADNAGLPGAAVATVTGEFTRVPTGDQYFDRDEYIYTLTLAEPLLVLEGLQHIGARFPGGGGDGTNYWMTSDGQPDGGAVTGSFSLDQGATWVNSGAGWHHAFEISGTVPEGTPRDAHGLRHIPDGGAEISVNEGGDLVISNIGSSGQDGVSVILGPTAEGYRGSMAVAAFPDGASAAINLVGTINGTPDLPLTSTTMTAAGGVVAIKPIVPGTYTLYLYNGGGDPVYTESGIDPEDDRVLVSAGSLGAFTATSELIAPTTANVVAGINTPTPVTVSVAGQGDYTADRIEMVPDGGIDGLEAVSLVALRFANTGDVAITAESLRKFTLDNSVTGASKFRAQETGLVVSGIGTGTEDGISQALPNVTSLDATLAPVSVPSSLSRFQMTAYNNGTEAEVGTVGLLNLGGLTGVPASYAGVGATQVRVEIYLAGEIQVSYVTNNSPLRVALVLPGADGQPELNGVGQIDIATGPGTYLKFDRVGSIQEPPGGGGASADGDEVRVIADNPGGTIGPLTRLEWDFSKIAPVTITSLVYFPRDGCTPAFDGDVNFDGCTDAQDLIVVLSGWDGGGGEGDADCTGVIDFDDLLLVLTGWSGEGECN